VSGAINTNLELTPGDPRRTIHFVIGRTVARWRGLDTPGPGQGDSALAWGASRDSPESRYAYALMVSFAWCLSAFAFIVASGVGSVSARALFGDATAKVVAEACFGGGMFCVAGMANVLWRMYYFVPKARRLVHRGETNTEEYARVMRATLPRNSSLIFQSGVAIAAFLLALSSW
jgi:hypothetical protein